MKSISRHVGSRTPVQVRTHAQKHFAKQRDRVKDPEAEQIQSRRQRNATTKPYEKQQCMKKILLDANREGGAGTGGGVRPGQCA